METLQPKFIEIIPDSLEDGILYISMERRIAIHLCVCGCKNEVVTPISDTDWELRFHGDSVSLLPSIGNWQFPCRSHYWIKRNKIEHSRKWDQKEIQTGREKNKKNKKDFFNQQGKTREEPVKEPIKKTRWASFLEVFGVK